MPVAAALTTRGLTKSYGSLTAVAPLDLELEPGRGPRLSRPERRRQDDAHPDGDDDLAADGRLLRSGRYPRWPTGGNSPPDRRPARERRLPGRADRRRVPDRYHARLYGQSRSSGARDGTPSFSARCGLDERAGVAGIRPTAVACGSASGSLAPSSTTRRSSSSTSRRSGLDPAGQRQVLTLVGRIARDRGSTVVLSTHLLAEVEEVCDRVLIIHRGRVVVYGTVAEVAARAAAPRAAQVRVPAEQSDRGESKPSSRRASRCSSSRSSADA